MSFIRCLSNPESLYVWSTGENVYFAHHVKKPNSSGANFDIPDDIFRACARKWVKNFGDLVSHRGMRVEEVVVDQRTGKIIPPAKPCARGCIKKPNGFIMCRPCGKKWTKAHKNSWWPIQVSYKKHFIRLWRVTWEYMIRRFEKNEG